MSVRDDNDLGEFRARIWLRKQKKNHFDFLEIFGIICAAKSLLFNNKLLVLVKILKDD